MKDVNAYKDCDRSNSANIASSDIAAMKSLLSTIELLSTGGESVGERCVGCTGKQSAFGAVSCVGELAQASVHFSLTVHTIQCTLSGRCKLFP